MFQHIVISPKKTEVKKTVKNEEPEEIEVLSLAPFTSTPKLSFDDVKIGTILTKKILIRNPTSSDVKLYLQKVPPGERNVSFNWTEMHIPAASDEIFEITWRPLAGGAWRDVVQLSDNGRIRRDIYIAFISLKPTVKAKKFGVKVKTKISPKKKSPMKRLSVPVAPRPTLRTNTILPQLSLPSPTRRATFKVENKENLPFTQPNQSIKQDCTYTISPFKIKSMPIEENFDDSLEAPSIMKNLSPCTYNNQMANIPYTPLIPPRHKNIKISPITPLTSKPSFSCSTGDSSINLSQKELSSMNTFSKDNCSAETYVKGDLDLSGGTYVKSTLNLSGGTYVKSSNKCNLNLSGGTYVKANLSGGTYVKDSSIGNLAELQLSPFADNTNHLSPSLSTLDFSPISASPLFRPDKLGKISEESSFEATPKKRKRKSLAPKTLPIISNCTFDVSPGIGKQSMKIKKVSPVSPVIRSPSTTSIANTTSPGLKKISPVKRLSNAYSKKPLHLGKLISKSFSVINSTAVTTTSTYNPDLFYNNVCNPYILAETTGVDPFMAVTMYYDPQWMDEQIMRFKNWLNVLLRPPEDLDCKVVKIDVAKMWQECRNKEIEKAPTKEQVSCKYNRNNLLQSLRRNATKLFRSPELIVVLSKCNGMVENNKIVMRSDKCLHQDVGLQKEILRLFFCYNPLWLRIGLETVFCLHIHLRSNIDVMGLSSFLLKNFFNNQYLLKKYKHKSVPQYAIEVKKEAIKKFLTLIYFLDQAKEKQLIPYDPCLFVKTAPIKESKEILLRFSSELFSAIGDVTKPLRLINYILVHKQNYIHEFEYGVENLGSDLKDGVRLTRVMEIILLEPNLTVKCRVPAISRLQKIHNVKIAFDALKRANYNIESNIEPKDIVEGHREKTLSFLWQIIYKFQSPRFTKAVITVQTWWRSKEIQEKLTELRNLRARKHKSACVIQSWYRRYYLRMKLETLIPQLRLILNEIKREKAAVKIQAAYRMFSCRKRYLLLYQSTLIIQKNFRHWYEFSHLRKKRNAAVCVIQRFWKAYAARQQFLKMKQSVAVISNFYVAIKQRRQCQKQYLALRHACIFIQQRYRANKAMKTTRLEYVQLYRACCIIQGRWKATMLMRLERNQFLKLKNVAIVIQRRVKANNAMITEKERYIQLREATIAIQRHLRATIAMKKQRKDFLVFKQNVIKIQIWFRSLLAMRKERNNYQQIQQAVVCIQTRFRALKKMKVQLAEYTKIKLNVLVIQRRFRANNEMKRRRNEYLSLRQSVINLQRRFRANLLAKKQRNKYLLLKKTVVIVETRYKAKLDMICCRNNFIQKRNAAIIIQTRFRALILGRECRQNYQQLQTAVHSLENRYLALVLMRTERLKYLKLLRSTILIQRKLNAHRLMLQERQKFLHMKDSIIKIQRYYRGYELMRQALTEKHIKLQAIETIQCWFRHKLARKNAAIVLQRRYRARLKMKSEKCKYDHLKKCTTIIQQHWRATIEMKLERCRFRLVQNSIIKIQQWYRSIIIMRKERLAYQQLKHAAVIMQRRFRAQLLMKYHRNEYLERKRNVINVQRRFRANILRKQQRTEYLGLRNATVNVQQRFRANVQCKLIRGQYQQLKKAVDVTETRYLAKKEQKACRTHYIKLKKTVIWIQRIYKAKLLARQIYIKQKHAVSVLEHWYLAIMQMRRDRTKYLNTMLAIVLIQRKFRAFKLMKIERKNFLQQKTSATKIQEYYRGFKEMQTSTQARFAKLRAVFLLQVWGRGVLARRNFAKINTPEAIAQLRLNQKRRSSATKIQACWRGFKVRSSQSKELEEIRIRSDLVTRTAKPENTIQNRTSRNIRIIANEDDDKISMIQIIKALEDLCTTTRLCQESCYALAEKMICTDLYDQITNSCHSRADVEAASVVAGILVNIAKCKCTSHYAWLPSKLHALIKNMHRFCDKEHDLFLKLATLIWIFGHEDEYKAVIIELPNFLHSMAKMLSLCERQQKIVRKSYKAKTVSIFATYENLALPTVKPDWGLDYIHAPHMFSNSVHAIRSLCQLFNV